MLNKKARRSILFLLLFASFVIGIIISFSSCTIHLSQRGMNSSLVENSKLTSAQQPVATRVVRDAFGEVEIPLYPKRIIVLDDSVYLDPVLALGIKPVGIRSCAPKCKERFRGIPDELAAGIQDVIGIEHYPSLEKILLLKPDLILAHVGQNNSLLSAIAPTVSIDYFSVLDFKKRLRYIAQIFGKSDRAEEILSQYNDRIQQLRQALGDKLETKKVALLYYERFHIIPVKPDDSTPGQIIKDVGLRFIEAQAAQQEGFLNLSIEVLPEYDADYIFIITSREEHDNTLSFLKEPIWSTLKAAQNKNIYTVDWEIGGTIGANRVIGDLYKYLDNTS